MVEAEEDQAGAPQSVSKEINELQMQLEILRLLYQRAQELYRDGRADAQLQRLLKMRGFGDWSLENVYAFIYESAVDLPGSGHHAFVDGIRDSDFEGLLIGEDTGT